MPYQSDSQARLMRAVAHSPSFAKKVGIPQSVGQKFESHKAKGGALKESEMPESKAMAKKEISFMKKGAPKSMIKHEKAEYGMKKGGMAYAKGGFATVPGGKLPASSQWKGGAKGSSTASGLDKGNKSADGIAQRGKTRGDNIVMKAKGGKC